VTLTPESAPLSQTGLYPGLREFYSTAGVDAWAETVPLHVTCNPKLAETYAAVIVRFVQDAVATGRVDPNEPFYVAELGAGTGKFGFHLVRRLRELRQALGLEHLRIVLVMSDVADSNIDHWRHHPRLRPFLERGELILARFDVEADDAFHPVALDEAASNDAGPPSALAKFVNPLVVIANYVFDSLPQDLFDVGDGHLEEMLATTVAAGETGQERVMWSRRGIDLPHYHDPELDGLLAEVVAKPGAHVVLFPVVALRALRRLADSAAGRLCLLVSDLGLGRGLLAEPEMKVKAGGGFFYLPVDLSIVGQFFGQLGPGIHRHRPATHLDTSLSVSGFDANELRETRHAFSTSAEAFGARGRAALSSLLERGGATLDPEEWLGLSAFVRYDSVFLDASTDLISRWVQAGILDPEIKREVIATLRLFGAEIYWTPGAYDTYFSLATILHELGELRAAVAAYVLSIETVGPSVDAYVNLALALRALDRRSEAMESLRDALALDPSHVVARGWLGRIELELAGQLPANPPPPLGASNSTGSPRKSRPL
jgi:hypothetical protein